MHTHTHTYIIYINMMVKFRKKYPLHYRQTDMALSIKTYREAFS